MLLNNKWLLPGGSIVLTAFRVRVFSIAPSNVVEETVGISTYNQTHVSINAMLASNIIGMYYACEHKCNVSE